jgi:hypothetical protein
MALRTSTPAGAPCWADLWTTDAVGSRRFYSELFGWEALEPSPEFGGYWMFSRDGAPVAVTARGLLTGRPARLSVGGGPWMPVTGWSAPWPVEERWWSRGRRRAARLQVLAGGSEGRAYLLVVERGRWRVEAAYD